MVSCRFRVLVIFLCAAAPAGGAEAGREALDFFEARVRPVLAARCFECHGVHKQKGGLRLDSRAALLAGGDRGPAAVPGNPGESLLIQAVRRTHEDLAMPPRKRLPDAEVAALARWIELGAPWPEGAGGAGAASTAVVSPARRVEALRESHWAFRPIRRPEPPAVEDASWSENPIDRFVRARLDAAGIAPSPRAPWRTLLRRLSFALAGLPPRPGAAGAFLRAASPESFAKEAEKLLASPRYGERWARRWLDVARYADSKGYVDAGEPRYPFAYTYRDWTIRAFAGDLPFERFVLEQLAADQLALEDPAPLAALGFLTVGHRYNFFPHEVIDDRIDVVSRGFLGLTVTCARCHDHKYDPIPTEDYYSLYGVFASSREPPPDELPRVAVGAAEDAAMLGAVREKAAAYKARRRELHERIQHEMRAWARDYLVYIVETTPEHRTRSQPPLRTERGLLREVTAYGEGGVVRWRRFIETCGPDHPVFGIWNRAMALPREGFAERVRDAIDELARRARMNPLLAEALANDPPQTMRELAETTGRLLEETEALWRERAAGGGEPAPFEDPAREELRHVLYGPDAPASVSIDESVELYHLDEHTDVRSRFAAIEKAFLGGDPAPRAMVLVDRQRPVEPCVFVRGDPGNPGPAVDRRVPRVLAGVSPEPFTRGSGRLELARATAHPENPLAARVIANRVWAWHFGEGLVATPSDFGLRSSPPSHPELLDFLASWFIENGGSIKALNRLIVLSRTWQQESAGRPEARSRDPENRLLWRFPRRRLDFEAMRDGMLAVSGRLEQRFGGPPVAKSPDDPEARCRSIYCLLDREHLAGVLRVFDFPSPDISSPERSQTTVPQQALFLLNSPFVIAQARALAEGLDASFPPGDVAGRVRRLYRLVYSREPEPEEIELASRFIARRARPTSAPAAPERASAWRYGFGEYEAAAGRLLSFEPLPHWSGERWQGGPAWPDPELHYLRLDARGGHAGIDRRHAAVRRWVAPRAGSATIGGTLAHGMETCGDGVEAWIVSSRSGELGRWQVYRAAVVTLVEEVDLAAGETVDFVVSLRENHQCDLFEWAPAVRLAPPAEPPGAETETWDAARDFAGPGSGDALPAPWIEYAQVLLQSNEFQFLE